MLFLKLAFFNLDIEKVIHAFISSQLHYGNSSVQVSLCQCLAE